MEISDLVWKLFLVLLPGVITTLFVRYITTNKSYTPFYFIIYSATLGLGTFFLLEIVYSIGNIIKAAFSSKIEIVWGLNLSIWESMISGKSNFRKKELILSYITAIPFGLIIGYLIQRKTLHNFLQRIRLTTRFGDGDVWTHFLNMEDVEWVIVRDNKNNLAYYGNVRSYSEANDKREILLEEVDVYTSDSWIKLYSSNAVLLELDDKHFSIEIPQPINKEENG